jgi:hypothetical protein
MDGSLGEFSLNDGDPRSGATKMDSSLTPGTTAGRENASMAPSPVQSKRNVLVAALSTVLVLAATFVVVLEIAARRAPAAAAPPRTVDTGAGAADAPATHEVMVRAFPDGATVTIDGAEVSNPVTRTCVHGNGLSIHASSPGSVSADRKVSCERDESIEIALTAQPKPTAPPVATRVVVQYVPTPPRGAAPVKPVAPPPPPRTDPTTPPRLNDVSPTGGTKPNRPIDTSSPYGQ